jgi:serine/threonine protein kinase
MCSFFTIHISPNVNVVLRDFGHAVEAIESEDHIKGTVRYLAPEILALKRGRTSKPYNCLIDVWALGIITLELDIRRQVQSENMAQEWAEELQQRAQEPKSISLAIILPHLLRVDAGKKLTMQQIVETLDQQVSSAGKMRTEGGGEPASMRKPFPRRTVLEMPIDHNASH